MKKVSIRQETAADYPAVFSLIKAAFENEAFSNHQEHFLVERLRKSDAFIPELSIVAETESKIIGHILLTQAKIKNDNESFDSLALAPVTVLPEYQGKGIGAQLIEYAHNKAKALGHESVVLLGHEDYYPRFGYQPADTFNITFPFDAPAANCMAVELTTGSLSHISGVVEYARKFFE